jgi:hypothetical protein
MNVHSRPKAEQLAMPQIDSIVASMLDVWGREQVFSTGRHRLAVEDHPNAEGKLFLRRCPL